MPTDTISNTKIMASKRLSEKRDKPSKANSMQYKTEDKRTLLIHYRTPPSG
jgi:hypothetical protein